MNSKSFKTEAEYTSPALKVYNVKLKEIIATSYGDSGRAGQDPTESDEYTYGL